MTEITIRTAAPDRARHLLEASHALMQALFDPEDNHYLEIDALRAPTIHFLVAEDAAGRVLGCGALASKPGYGELKSMFTDVEARGLGIASGILAALEAEARRQGLPLLRLETGDKLEAAHRVYQRAGFVTRGPFGDYTANSSSIFMEKPLGN